MNVPRTVYYQKVTHMCFPQTLTVNGEFEEWSQWSPCGGNCSLYSKTRSRYCKLPVCGGRLCDGAQMETSVCSWEPCK